MKAAELKAIKSPLETVEVPVPEPGPEEVLIKQKMTGICYRDILTQDGYLPRVRLPIIPGHEISGIIVSTGVDVKNFRVGDRVASLIYEPCGKCEYCLSGRENLCKDKKTFGESIEGAYAPFVKVNERSLVKVPDGVSEEGSVIAACVTGMLYHALAVEGKIEPGQTVLITGAGGGIGAHAVEISKALGAKVIAETSSEWKREKLLEMGTDHVVSSRDDFEKDVKKITGQGVDLVLECVGIYTFSKALRSLKPGGRMVVVGNLIPDPVELPLGLIILKGNSVIGSISSTRNDISAVFDLELHGKLKPIIDRTVDLASVEDAYREIRSRKNIGRVLIKF
ncbi:MAG: zinc-binding dehydrogenase [Thermoplasmataceae archaeon]|jgi:D-arabinose 1-dehydrogenase-like Zn-dependent alcohol dehydrogenase